MLQLRTVLSCTLHGSGDVYVLARENTKGLREFLFINVCAVPLRVITAACLISLGGKLCELSKIYVCKMNTRERYFNWPFGEMTLCDLFLILLHHHHHLYHSDLQSHSHLTSVVVMFSFFSPSSISSWWLLQQIFQLCLFPSFFQYRHTLSSL